ncbi:MAG: VOC family protein [Balneolaceae bacterium]
MNPKSVVLSLPVKNPEHSLAFYRDGLGLETSGIEEGIISLEIANLSLFLIEKNEFEKYSKAGNLFAHLPGKAVECILSCALDSKEEVDEILKKAEANGGSIPNPPADEPWGYTGYFRDPDGHLWEIVWSKKSD